MRRLHAIATAVCALLLPVHAIAQTSVGEIFGKVTDESGASLPGVTITLESAALIRPFSTITSARGTYLAPSLPIGSYRVRFELAGFSKVVREGVKVETGFAAEVNGKLKVSALEETVTVSGEAPIIDTKSSNWSYGLVGHAPDFLNRRLPWGLQMSAHYNSSENFNAAAAGRNLYAEALPFPSGKTEEWGVSFYNGQFSVRFAHFETDQLAATVNFPGQTTLWQEMANIYQWNSPAEIAASGFQVPAEIVQAVNFRQTGVTYANGNPEYIQTNPVQANIKETQDYTSKGFEIEATYSPTKQWRIAANLAKVNSITSNTAPYLSEFIERVMIPMWNDPKIGKALYSADRGALNNPDNLFGARSTGLLNQVRSAQARDGTPVTDARRYRFNLLTNYDFARGGRLAGFSVGAGVRYQSKISIGNALRELAPGSGTYGPDPAKPYYGPAETNFDAWAGYQRKLDFIQADWSIKFRIRNIGVGNELIPSRANPDGTVYEARIAEPQVWEIVNNLRF